MSLTGLAGYCCAAALAQRNASVQTRFLAFNAHLLDDRTELLDLALEDRVLLGRARADRLGADVAQALGSLRMLYGGRRFFLQPLDHLARCFRRCEEAIPPVGFKVGETELARRLHVGQVRDALRRVGGKRLDLAGLDIRERGRELVAADVDAPGDQLLLERRG